MVIVRLCFRQAYLLVTFSFFVFCSGSIVAQNLKNDISSAQVLVLDLRKALNESKPGQSILDNYRDKVIALNNEFSVIETQLIAEEQKLLDIKPTMRPGEFLKLARAFDEKSTETRELYRSRKRKIDEILSADTDRLALLLSQVAGAVMEEKGAMLVMMKNQVIVSSNKIDITSIVMERANQIIDLDSFVKID